MKVNCWVEVDYIIGSGAQFTDTSVQGRYKVIFEEQGQKATFAVWELAAVSQLLACIPVYDSTHLPPILANKQPCHASILWTQDVGKVVLLLNDWACAAYDFSARRGYSDAVKSADAQPDTFPWDQRILDELLVQA